MRGDGEGGVAVLHAGWSGQQDLAGPFEMLVLAALIRLGRDAAASQVRECIEARLQREIPRSSVRTTLGRMETKGWVRSWSRGPVGDRWRVDRRPGPNVRAARRFHSIEPLGRRALRRTLGALDGMREGLPGLDPGSTTRRAPGVRADGCGLYFGGSGRWWRGFWFPGDRPPQRRRRWEHRQVRRRARGRRTRLLRALRGCGFDVGHAGRLVRVHDRFNQQAAVALREGWGVQATPPPPRPAVERILDWPLLFPPAQPPIRRSKLLWRFREGEVEWLVEPPQGAG